MGRESGLLCESCGKTYPAGSPGLTCPVCGPLRGTLTVLYPYDDLRSGLTRAGLADSREPSLWRFSDLLPVALPTSESLLRVGGTPLYPSPGLAGELGVRELFLKDEGVNPSASLKDRATVVAIGRAQAEGQRVIVAASTGNAAASLAQLSASVGMRALVLVPETTPRAKLAQLLLCGANVMQVRAGYDQAFELSLELARVRGFACRSTAVNPYLGEGKKTAAFEIALALNFATPDVVVVGAGDGCILQSLYKGFWELDRLGLCSGVPKVCGVQPEGSSALVRAFERGLEVPEARPARSVADSLCVDLPRDGVKALRAVRRSGGALVAVGDDEILKAMRVLARRSGVFAEPAGAAGLAGIPQLKACGVLSAHDRVVVVVTGHGLKDPDHALQAAQCSTRPVAAELAAVLEAAEELGC